MDENEKRKFEAIKVLIKLALLTVRGHELKMPGVMFGRGELWAALMSAIPHQHEYNGLEHVLCESGLMKRGPAHSIALTDKGRELADSLRDAVRSQAS